MYGFELDFATGSELDFAMSGTSHWAHETSCVNGHEFTEDNTLRDSRGYRHCRTCKRERMRAYRAKPKNGDK